VDTKKGALESGGDGRGEYMGREKKKKNCISTSDQQKSSFKRRVGEHVLAALVLRGKENLKGRGRKTKKGWAVGGTRRRNANCVDENGLKTGGTEGTE